MTHTATVRGLTWDHPRGYDALAAAVTHAHSAGLDLHWDKQPLEGFESASISELAQRYDLLVIDHPHLGDALASDCLQNIDRLFDPAQLAEWRTQSIGRSFTSYRYAGQQWAIPLDAATQVSACRPDLSADPAPSSWTHMPAYAKRHPVCLSLAGPHAFLTLCSMAHAFGACMGDHQETLFAGGDATSAWELLLELYAYSPAAWETKNPIDLLHGMSTTEEVAYCPLVYGYVNYAGPNSPGRQLTFGNAPAGPNNRIGSVLGGTGIAITQRCPVTPALLRHLEHLMSISIQTTFIPANQGQPSARKAWQDRALNLDYNDFYAKTLPTLEEAFVRPRFLGYTRFQLEASQLVREMLAARTGAKNGLARLQAMHDAALNKANCNARQYSSSKPPDTSRP